MTWKYFQRMLFILELHIKIATLTLIASGCPNQSLFVPEVLNSHEWHEGHMSLCQQEANIPFLTKTRPYSLKTTGLHSAHQKLLVKFSTDQVYQCHLKRFKEHLVLSICLRILNQGNMVATWSTSLSEYHILRSIWPFCTTSFRDSSKYTA